MTTSVIAASNSRDQSVEFGVVGGVLAVGAILAISVASAIIVVFMMKRRKRMPVEKGTLCHVATLQKEKCQFGMQFVILVMGE